jgi:hypothetical protein
MRDQIQSKQAASTEAAPTGCLGLILRLFWMMLGNLALVLLAVFIFHRHAFSTLDIVFWAVVFVLFLVRYIDVTRLHGLTSNGKRATLKDWRAYVLKMLAVFVVLWGLAHGLSYLVRR